MMGRPWISLKCARAILLLLACGAVIPVFGQVQDKLYHDAFGLQGSVNYRGVWPVDSAFPEKGPYTLRWRHLERDTLRTYLTKGNLRGHMPHGKWSWQQADWNFSIEPGSGIEPRFATEGEEQFWEGQFALGEADGSWIYRLSEKKQGQTAGRGEHRIEIKSAFQKGQMRGAWSVHDRNPEAEVRIAGRTNERGEAHGKWTYRYSRFGEACREERSYADGMLLTVKRYVGKDTVVVNFKERLRFFEAGTQSDSLVAQSYTVVGDLEFTNEEVSCYATRLLQHYLYEHLLKGWELDIFPLQFERRGPVFRRLKYLLNPDESNMRDSLYMLNSTLQKGIDAVFEGRSPDIARARSQELDLAVGALQAALIRVSLIDSLLKHSESDDFLYIERNRGGLERGFGAINTTAAYMGQAYPEGAGQLPLIDLRSDSIPYLAELYDVMQRTAHYIEAHLHTAEEIFVQMKRQGELNALESEMLNKLERLDSLYSNKGRTASMVLERWIERDLQQRIRAYAQNDDYKTGRELAAGIIMEMDSLLSWSADWERLDRLDAELDAAYTYNAYNPYTGENDIPLGVKNRFRRQVIQVLLPHMRAQLELAESWEEFTDAYHKMVSLRRELIRYAFMDDRSDRRIERRVRQENRPEKMLQIFMQHMEGR